jgi:hypothetical protein
MQPVSPYRLGGPLGRCQVGTVWSAVDEQGRPLTVAFLDTAAHDQGWREAFSATVTALAEPGPDRPRYVRADVQAGVPWAAYAGEGGLGAGAERVFESLGLQVLPADNPSTLPPAPPVSAAPASSPSSGPAYVPPQPTGSPTSPPPAAWPAESEQPTAAIPSPSRPSSAQPMSAQPMSAQPMSAQPTSAQPSSAQPMSAQPSSGPAGVTGAPAWPTQQPSAAWPIQQPSGAWPIQSANGAGWNAPSAAYPASGAGSAYQTSSPPGPVSGLPVSPADSYGLGYGSSVDPLSGAPGRRIEPSPPRKGRGRLWLIVAAVVVVLLIAAGVVYYLVPGRDDSPVAGPTASAAPQQIGEVPTAPPANPGIEPPRDSKGWPAGWPSFTANDKVSTLALEGFGFPVKVPLGWQCTLAGRAPGYVKYNCGTAPGAPQQLGGEISVRDCSAPCDGRRQAQMRQAEEAWGTRWQRAGPFAALAETQLDADGELRHALVVVGYYRGSATGDLDHQVVLRMTAPVKDATQVRRIATYLHYTLVF